MKKLTLIIAMLLTAAVAFGQGKGLVMNEKGFHAEGALGYIDKGAFLNKVVSPYIDLKGGMMTDYTFSGTGWFVSPSIGISFCRRFSIFAAAEGTVNQYGRGTGK